MAVATDDTASEDDHRMQTVSDQDRKASEAQDEASEPADMATVASMSRGQAAKRARGGSHGETSSECIELEEDNAHSNVAVEHGGEALLLPKRHRYVLEMY